ncbi:MAG: alpha/beta hydrolase, partial [Woeseia sp.]
MSTETDAGNTHETIMLDAPDGHRIHTFIWLPASGTPAGTVQIVHGLAEHAARYERFAQYLAGLGVAVIAHNHRGHGAHLDSSELGHFADRDGWQKVLGDVELVHAFAAQKFGPVPRLLFGHSMGS